MKASKKPLALAILASLGIVSFVFGYWNSHGKHFGEYQDEANVFVDVPKVGQRWSTPVKAHSIPKNRTEKKPPILLWRVAAQKLVRAGVQGWPKYPESKPEISNLLG